MNDFESRETFQQIVAQIIKRLDHNDKSSEE